MRTRTALLVTALVTTLLALAVPTVVAADRDVAIRDFAFGPQTVEIRVGDTVTWTNRDSVAHTATGRTAGFDTGLLDEGESASIRFTAAGTYRYVCTPHPDMTGTVVVRAAAGGMRPPDTDTADPAGTERTAAPGPAIQALLALLGIASLAAQRAIGRRRETT